MKNKLHTKNRITSIFLVIAILLSTIYIMPLASSAADANSNRVADPSTMDAWKALFPIDGDLSTENAGGVWMDKSVFTDASAFAGLGITQDDPNSFLVALSAMAANMSVTGVANVPTDTMIVLDLSSSMYNGSERDPSTVQTMLNSVNQTITDLQKLNVNNRVGVVVYYGGVDRNQSDSSNSMVLLPLDRYSGTNTYLKATLKSGDLYSVSVNSGVKNSAGNTMPQTTRVVTDVAGTYAQLGLLDAMTQLLNADTVVPATADYQPGAARTPIVVFMSDGEPTAATHQFTQKVNAGMGNNTISIRSANETDFVTQLTAAYVKEMVDLHYEQADALFYSLSLGTSVSLAVMDPANNTPSTIDGYWDTLLKNGSVKITVYNSPNGWSSPSVEKTYTVSTAYVGSTAFPSNKAQRNYVDKSFTASNANQLSGVFSSIIKQINLVSKYTPTLVSGNADLSGYISFVDKIGEYMSVTDIKGILIDNHLFSGADLSSNFIPGGGNLGTYDNPTALGIEMVAAVRARLGLDSNEVARTLIGLAYEYGQLSYTDADNYSNYIGWYANAAGQFLGFYHEGVTVPPAVTGNAATDPAFTIRSYGYLGAVDESQGVTESDMMYATVQVRKNIITGEELVTFAVPAALIPIVSYDVTLDKNGDLAELAVSGADNPIRLVYEVALDDSINAFNVKEIVSAEYLADKHNVNDDGTINFYTNQWDHENTTGYGTVNTYSYFNPSRQNDKYYYLEDAPVYSDTSGTLYTDGAQPSAEHTLYRSYTVYKNNGSLHTETVYRSLSDAAKATAVRKADGSWYIPKGNVHVNLDGYTVDKTENLTGTLGQSYLPFVDTHNHSVNDEGYNFYVGATLGNNGKLTLTPETGIKLTKTMAEGATATTEAFTFTVENVTDPSDNSEYPVWLIKANGTEEVDTVQFTNGVATVMLHPGDVLYIGGLTANDTFSITENETVEYVASATGLSENGTVTIRRNEIIPVSFVNDDRGIGNLTIDKEVEHDFGTDYQIPADKVFTMLVTLSGVGTANATFTAEHTNGDYTEITTDANGQFTITLKHDEQFEVFGLPAGTTATVVEQDPADGFTPAYWDNGVPGDGVVTVVADSTVSVIVVNDYEATEVYPVSITVSGNKTLSGREWLEGDVFSFKLEKLLADGSWQQLGETVTASYGKTDFQFSNAFENERYSKPGTYYYRVVEIEPENPIGGISYDKTVHSFSVVVSDTNMDGQLEIAEVTTDRPNTTEVTATADGWDVFTKFKNTYSTSGTATVTIDVNKAIENNGGSDKSLAGYTFGLFDPATGDQIGNLLTTTARGFARFVLNYDAADIGTGNKTYTYILKEVAPDPIPAGWTYSTEQITVTVEVIDNGDGTISAVIYTGSEQPATAGNSISTTFTNTYDPNDTELTIDFVNKELDGRDLIEGEFTFEVQTQSGTKVLEGTNTAAGKVIFDGTLKFDRVGIYFYNIVETSTDGKGVITDKTTYRVTVTVTDANGRLTASYVLVNATGNTITFKNTYKTTPAQHSIAGKKNLRGRTLINDEFTFVLTELTANGVVIADPVTQTARNFKDGSFVFPTITYNTAGTYTYSVEEVVPDGGSAYGIIYDTTIYKVTVVVIDDGEGALKVESETVTLLNNTPASALTFLNYYEAKDTSAQFFGEKQLTGKIDNTLQGGEYAFELYDSNENWERGTLIETVTNGADGTFTFTKIDFTEEGDQYFIVTEKNAGLTIDGVTYDDTVYFVWVEVIDDLKGQLHATVHIYDGEGIPQDSILFVNVYEITGDATVTLSGEKALNGREFNENDSFCFELYEADENFDPAKAPKITVDMDPDTHRYMITLDYTAKDAGNTFYYVLKEKNAGLTINGIVYSEAVYKIKVVVEDNGVGGIKTTVTIENATTSTLNFVNEYVSDKTSTTFEGTKVLNVTGGIRELKENDFTFDLYNATERFESSGMAIQSVKNNADGSFAFDAVEFTKAGIYRFIIKENSEAPIGGVIYDNTQYHITVTVLDNGMGKLIVSNTTILKVTSEASAATDEIEFINDYITQSTTVTIGGTKELGGRDLMEGEFKFLLHEADETFAILEGSTAMVAMNKEDGSFFFDALTFTEAGTYFFVIFEDNTVEAERVSFDQTVYYVTIEVTDDENGKLVASDPVIVKQDSSDIIEGITFTNVYVQKPNDITVEIDVHKTVVNIGTDSITPEGFKFLLQAVEADAEGVTVTSDADGNANFTLTFTEADIGKTFGYTLTELNDGRENVTYSTTEYNITISVALDEETNTLVATFTQNDVATEKLVAEFENIYDFTPPAQTGDKTITRIVLILTGSCALISLLVYSKKRRGLRI